MSTQTQFTAKSAEEFLKKYATVVGTNKAVEDKNSDFLIKYSTVVGSMEAINIVAPEAAETSVVSDDETPEVPTEPAEPTEPTDDAGAGEGTDNQGD